MLDHQTLIICSITLNLGLDSGAAAALHGDLKEMKRHVHEVSKELRVAFSIFQIKTIFHEPPCRALLHLF